MSSEISAHRPRRIGLIACAAGVAMASLLSPSTAAAVDEHPCAGVTTRPAGQVQYCPIWMPARGYVPVHQFSSTGVPIERGRLVAAGSANWFICQSRTPDGYAPPMYSDPAHPYHNGWWAKTLSDDGVWGWTNQVYFSGGENDEADAALRPCAGGSAPPIGGATGTAEADPSGCEKLVEDQRISMKVRAREWWERVFQSGGGPPSYGGEYGHKSMDAGTIEITAATCLSPGGDWRIVRPISASATYKGVSLANGLEGDRAIIAAIRGYEETSSEDDPLERARLTVAISDCAKDDGWKTLETITTFPIPGVPYLVDLAQYVLGGWVIPEDQAVCHELGEVEVPLQVLAHWSGGGAGGCRPSALARAPLPCRQQAKPNGRTPGKKWRPAKRWQRVKPKGGPGRDRADGKRKYRWTARGWSDEPGHLLARSAYATFSELTPEGSGESVSVMHTLRADIGF